MSAAPLVSASDFVRDAARAKVADAAAITRAYTNAPPTAKWDAVALAALYVSLGLLTRFQADKLLRGQWTGLALGPYRLLSPLGRGGMGIVYLARNAETHGPLIALKVLPPKRAKEEPRSLARFLREKQIGLSLPPHAHLVRTLAAGEIAGVHFIALEYVDGKTVHQAVAADGPLEVAAAARVFADAATGLAAAHALNVVHRDLKPSNLMVTPAGRGKVLDFGFALIRGEPAPTDPTILGGPGYTLGTMDYLPPEQAADALNVGPAADLYALGCALYFAIAGHAPFPGGTAKDKMRLHRTIAPRAITQSNPTVPPAFADLIQRLMAKNPNDRPASAAIAARELAAFAVPVAATPVAIDTAELVKLIDERWAESPELLDDLVDVELVEDISSQQPRAIALPAAVALPTVALPVIAVTAVAMPPVVPPVVAQPVVAQPVVPPRARRRPRQIPISGMTIALVLGGGIAVILFMIVLVKVLSVGVGDR